MVRSSGIEKGAEILRFAQNDIREVVTLSTAKGLMDCGRLLLNFIPTLKLTYCKSQLDLILNY